MGVSNKQGPDSALAEFIARGNCILRGIVGSIVRGLSNPGKFFPTPRLCGELPGMHKGVHPLVASGQAEQF